MRTKDEAADEQPRERKDGRVDGERLHDHANQRDRHAAQHDRRRAKPRGERAAEQRQHNVGHVVYTEQQAELAVGDVELCLDWRRQD
jgi:hypothetical protein